MWKVGFLFLLIPIVLNTSYATTCEEDPFRVPICHQGSTNPVDICTDFGSLWGHLVQHSLDKVGKCSVDLEGKVDIFACNAGLRHRPHNNPLCFNRETLKVCQPATSCNGEENCNCVCSSGEDLEKQHLGDFFDFAKAAYGTSNPFYTPFTIRSGKQSYAVASTQQGEEKLSDSPRLTFSLGSDRIGSDYFADFCWRVKDANLFNTPLKLNANLTLTESWANGSGYLNMAQTNLKYGIFCDTATQGPLAYAQSPLFSTPYMPFFGGTFSAELQVPGSRSCFIRYKLEENETDYLRSHDMKSITLAADINLEPVGQVPGDDSIKFCHVSTINTTGGPQAHHCTSMNFPNTDALRIWMQLSFNDHRDFRQNNQNNYKGTCLVEGPCSVVHRNDLP
jgi:hypothetical protein